MNLENNNDSKVMSPEEWIAESYEGFPTIPRHDVLMKAYASYVLQHRLASRLQIKLPEKKEEYLLTQHGRTYLDGNANFNSCIEETKRLNGITE